jgi:hypothetical protein
MDDKKLQKKVNFDHSRKENYKHALIKLQLNETVLIFKM